MDKKKMWYWLAGGGVLLVLIVGLILGLTLSKKGSPVTLSEATAVQIEKEQKINVGWKTDKPIDKVVINVIKSNGHVDNSVTITNATQLAKGTTTLDASYGKNQVEVIVYNGDHASSKKLETKVFTDEYVIAPLVATMPVTLFSLNLQQYTQNYTIPTFVWLQRGSAWNYNAMPKNVYLMPLETLSTMSTLNDAGQMYIKTSQWVGELYEMNPESKFHLYVNDYHPYVWMQATIANHIPASQYDVTLLSDGTASKYVYDRNFGGENASEIYERMLAEYKDFKQGVYNKNNPGSFDTNGLPFTSVQSCEYVVCMLNEEPNLKVVLTSMYNNSKDTDFAQQVTQLKNEGKIEVVALKSLLDALGDQGKLNIKSLYKFSDDIFEKAATENKKVMLLMGTKTTSEINFDEYVAATKAYYGDEYVYYYKGHPGSPTIADPVKAEHLEELGLIDVDSSIAAELIFFFNQEIVGTGYGSTTYGSLNPEQVGGIWGTSLSNATNNYSSETKFVINKLTSNNANFGSLATSNSYLFEFKDTTNYNIAVYDVNTNSIKYYKTTDSGFTEVEK